MKDRVFALPNVVVTVRFVGSTGDTKLTLYAPDRRSLEQRLKRRHGEAVEIRSVEPYDFTNQWGRKAKAKELAVDQARTGNRSYDFNRNAIWGELKDFLFDLFDDKCAYCECSLKATSYGAVEHYRPKHLYDWLAYDAANYLPTCSRCNTSKSDKFPLVPGCRIARTRADLPQERPLLLNPYGDGPLSSHITFVDKNGTHSGPIAKGLTQQGKVSIGILGLNRVELLTERFHEQKLACTDYIAQWAANIEPIPVLTQLIDGLRPFSAASLTAVQALKPILPSLS